MRIYEQYEQPDDIPIGTEMEMEASVEHLVMLEATRFPTPISGDILARLKSVA